MLLLKQQRPAPARRWIDKKNLIILPSFIRITLLTATKTIRYILLYGHGI
jgi:hypothetical protein